MGNAEWLFLALPMWYAGAIAMVIPAIGIAGLIIGIVWGAVARAPGLLFFLALPAASQVFVAIAGFMRGWFRNPLLQQTAGIVLLAFMLMQIAAAGYLVFRLKGARLPAIALAIFSLSYANFASLVAFMAFTEQWL